MASVEGRTVRDFGDQWTHYGENEGYYASLELLEDMLGPLLSLEALRGLRAADLGSGTGRIVRMLLEAGVEHVVAVEPSAGVDSLRRNASEFGDRVEVIHGPGDALPSGLDLDLVTSIGVVQFIPDPLPLLRAARAALRPGGRIAIWVYGREGLSHYLLIVRPLRMLTTRLPHGALSALCSVLDRLLDVYIWACRWLPLPLRDYLLNTVARLSRRHRRLTIYDQLNPSYARFYRGGEVRELLERAGFRDVRLFHRRGYSWTAVGVRGD